MLELKKYEDFKTTDEKYVVCINTMGQDRKFSEEEKLYALRTV